jgi:hypothetical protein
MDFSSCNRNADGAHLLSDTNGEMDSICPYSLHFGEIYSTFCGLLKEIPTNTLEAKKF